MGGEYHKALRLETDDWRRVDRGTGVPNLAIVTNANRCEQRDRAV